MRPRADPSEQHVAARTGPHRGTAPSTRTVLRILLLIVAVAATLYLIYLLQRPLGWLVIAAFFAVAVSGPVGRLARHVPRAAAIATVYGALVVVSVMLAALIVPRVAEQASALVSDLPRLVQDAQQALGDSDAFQALDERLEVGERLEELATDAPQRIGDAVGTLAAIGVGVVDSLFAVFSIFVLSVFMVASGPRWTRAALGLARDAHRERLERALSAVADAVAGYIRAQLTIALITSVSGYIVMTVLDVPFREPLAVVIAFASLIPVIGAPLWGVVVGLVTLTADFPTTTILWVVWAVVYPQFENYVLQPQLQKRAVHVEPFVIIVAVLFGGTLLGIIGALLAIPAAATLQIALREWWSWRRETRDPAVAETEGGPTADAHEARSDSGTPEIGPGRES